MPFFNKVEQHLKEDLGIVFQPWPSNDGRIRTNDGEAIVCHYGKHPRLTDLSRAGGVQTVISRYPMFICFRVGQQMFVDIEWQSKIGNPTARNKVTYYDSQNSSITEQNHFPYDSVVAASILGFRQTFHGQTVIDAGCNDGILGILALQSGANDVIGYDLTDCKAKVARSCDINQIPTEKFRFAQYDVGKMHEHEDSKAASILMANIGPHAIYGLTHLNLIKCLREMPNIRVVFIGGYLRKMPSIGEQPYLEAQERLMEQGFKEVKEFSLGVDARFDQNEYLACVMER